MIKSGVDSSSDDDSPWDPSPEARCFIEPAAGRYAAQLVLVGDAAGRLPSLADALHLLHIQLSNADGAADDAACVRLFRRLNARRGWRWMDASAPLADDAPSDDEPTIGEVLYDEAVRWVQDCTLADVSDLRIRIQLARALVAVHTRSERDEPNFTTLPPPRRRRRGAQGQTSV